ncbi:Sir2 family NAD-dependent protein deacetylase [Roseibium sp. RKSG952]|uniref:SIR2 family NAD-dependent protein deacylase n=1 Tax=Roseibium sp. RKSG952 TaxID=2529384 RepID=UPI0018AD1CF1|nr:Sir2 family NAD-dependent protein deacetylase [Roseibium sp. RKSG952]
MTEEARNNRVVFLTGAGLSADSGVPTFRGEGGLYRGRVVEDIVSRRGFDQQPSLVHEFCDERRVALASVAPNPAHFMISRISTDYGDRAVVMTQNIDDLLERAECENAIHLHGFLTRMRSIGNSKVVRDIGHRRYWSGEESNAPSDGFKFRCPQSKSLFRPDVVLFGELAPEYSKMHTALKRLRRDDLLVVIGTLGNVLPVAEFAENAPCRTILNNLEPSEYIPESAFDDIFYDRASVVADPLETIIRTALGPANESTPPGL